MATECCCCGCGCGVCGVCVVMVGGWVGGLVCGCVGWGGVGWGGGRERGGSDTVYVMCVCPYMTTCKQQISMGWCHCTSPFGWNDQPAKVLRLFPPKAGSKRPQVQTSPNPKSRKKIARLAHLTPHSFGGRGAQSFPSPRRWVPWIGNDLRRCTWTSLPG